MSSQENKELLESVKSDIGETVGEDREAVLSYFVIGVFVAILVLCVVFIGIQKTRQNKLATLDQEISADVTTPLKAMDKEQTQSDTVLKQLNILTSTLSGRIKYSALLNDLRANQFKRSEWNNFSLQKETIVINGKTDSFQDIAKVTAGFRNVKAVTDVKLTSAVLDKESGKVNFTLSIAYDGSLYKVAQSASGTGSAAAGTATQATPTATPAGY